MINRELWNNIKLKTVYSNNKNIEALRVRLNNDLKDFNRQKTEIKQNNNLSDEQRENQLVALNNKIRTAKEKCSKAEDHIRDEIKKERLNTKKPVNTGR